jgi:hypothetical protein
MRKLTEENPGLYTLVDNQNGLFLNLLTVGARIIGGKQKKRS